MAMWDRCAICGRAIPVGELCYGIKNWHGEPTNGDTICKDCLVPENSPTLTPPNEPLTLDKKRVIAESCLHYSKSGRCGLNGYALLDCPRCKEWQSSKKSDGGDNQ